MLILLRHGRTPHNAEARLQGLEDSPIDEVGHAQAVEAGAYIRSRYDIASVVTSTLGRTHQTVEAAGFGDLPWRVDERWTEIRFGEYDHRRISEVLGELTRRWTEDQNYAPPGGESLAAMYARVAEACEELIAEAADSDVLVVTHATPVKAAVAWAIGGDPSQVMRMRAHLASVTVIDTHAEAGTLLVEYNRRLADPTTDDPVWTAMRDSAGAPRNTT